MYPLKIVSVCLALCMLGGQAPVSATSTADRQLTARLDEAQGRVYKRDFVDWDRETWGDPQPAVVGDILHEGMQVGTGNDAWAKVSWPSLSTFAWANSVYALAPNKRLVFLTSGQMLYQLDKHRRDRSPYFVWTKLLSAQIHGTTVLVQASKHVSRITVLEGCIEVTNRIDHSRVKLSPGLVYEIREKTDDPNAGSTADGSLPATASIEQSQLTQIAQSTDALPVFETAKTISSIRPINPDALMAHPLLINFGSDLLSLALVKQAMKTVAQLVDGALNELSLNRLLKTAFDITSPPLTLDYKLGARVASAVPLSPITVENFPPTGIISAPRGWDGKQSLSSVQSILPTDGSAGLNHVGILPGSLAGVSPTASLAAPTSLPTMSTAFTALPASLPTALPTAAISQGALAPTLTTVTNPLILSQPTATGAGMLSTAAGAGTSVLHTVTGLLSH